MKRPEPLERADEQALWTPFAPRARDLTARESEVLEAVAAGVDTINRIAARLKRSRASVVTSLRRLRDFGVVQEEHAHYHEPKRFSLVPPGAPPLPREKRAPRVVDRPARRRKSGPVAPEPYYRGLRW